MNPPLRESSNRAMLLTAPGAAAIATVRIAGPIVAEFLNAHFSQAPRIGRCVHGQLREGDRLIDDPVVVLVNDEIADLHLHGGPWVICGCPGKMQQRRESTSCKLP